MKLRLTRSDGASDAGRGDQWSLFQISALLSHVALRTEPHDSHRLEIFYSCRQEQ